MSERRGDQAGTSPADAFTLLSNEVRVDVLRALFRTDEPQSYADLRAAVAYGGSGNFNYHLRKLVGPFVRKTEDGYVLTPAGDRVTRMVVAGTLVDQSGAGTRAFPCVLCGGVERRDEGPAVTAGCLNCGGATPAAASRGSPSDGLREEGGGAAEGDERLTPAEDRAVVHGSQLAAVLKDVCPACRGTTSLTVDSCPDHDDGSTRCASCGTWFAVWARGSCDRCSFGLRFPAGLAALYDATVVAAVDDAAADTPVPLLPRIGSRPVDGREVEDVVVSTEPLRVSVTLPVADRTLTVLLDESLSVQSVDPSA